MLKAVNICVIYMPLWTLKLIKIEFYKLDGIVNIQLLIRFILDRYYNTIDIFLNGFSPIDWYKLKRGFRVIVAVKSMFLSKILLNMHEA